MRAVVQRVDRAAVSVEGATVGAAERGLAILLGVGQGDSEQDVRYLAEKVVNLRIFSDEQGKMNLSLLDIRGDLLVVSQFTLYGDCRKGRRPGFDAAADPETAKRLYELFMQECRNHGVDRVESGIFQAEMIVHIDNHGPVTILLDSRKTF